MSMKCKKEFREYRDILVREEAYMRQVWQVAQSAPISDVSLSGQEKLRHLDQIRREHQSAIFEASKNGGRVCSECKGVCGCVGEKEVSHFHAIDFWLRRYTENPLTQQGLIYIEHPVKVLPRSLFRTILREMRDPVGNAYYIVRAVRRVKEKIGVKPKKQIKINPILYNPIPPQRILCEYLAENGCKLDSSDRGITCIIHTCFAFRGALGIESLRIIAGHMKRLRKIHIDVLELLKKEGKIIRYSGWTRLATPVLPFGTPSIEHVRRVF